MADDRHLIGARADAMREDLGESAFSDFTIAFFIRYAKGKRVLDLGCVNHNPQNYRSKYWVHKALRDVAARCQGLDLYADGVTYLRERGFDVIVGNAEAFDLDETFDVIVAGDLIEHLANTGGFLESVRRHLAPGGYLLLSTPNPWYWRYVVKSTLSWDVHPNPEHACWYCGATLRTLLARYDFSIAELTLGSRYLRDRLMPLPPGVKHTTIHAAARVGRRD